MDPRHKDARRQAQGTQTHGRYAGGNDRPATYDAPPSVLALLRTTWGRRDRLDAKESAIVRSFLERVQARPLTEAQLQLARTIGKRVGVGYDDPAEEAPIAPTGVRAAQPWGVLPLKPPGRV
jgi:hypothetical protein